MPSVADAIYNNRPVAEIEALLEAGGSANEDGLQSPLHHAAWNGDISTIKLLLQYGADITARSNFDGNSVLGCAIQNGHLGAVTCLLDHGAGIDAPCLPGWSTLRTAAHFGWPEIVQLLLSRGATFSGGEIHAAAYQGHLDVLKSLLKHGDVNGTYNGSTPLMAAFKGRKIESARYLLQNGADVSVPNNQGATVLHVAAVNDDVELVYLALEHGASPAAMTTGGLTVIGLAASVKVVTTVLDAGFPEAELSHALDECIDSQKPECVDLLLERGAKPMLTTRNITNRFFAAVTCESLKLVSKILDTGRIDVNVTDDERNGATALMLAAAMSKAQLMHLLLSYGAKTNLVDHIGRQALHWSTSLECVKVLLEAGAEVDAVNGENGLSPLQRAVMRGDVGITKLCLEYGAAVNKHTSTGIQWTAVIICARQTDSVETLKVLLDAGADADAVDADGRTAAWYAAAMGKLDMVKMLGHGKRDRFGATPLLAAVRNGHEDVVRVLLSRGADLHAVDQFGLTAAGWAEQTGQDKLLEMLRRAGCQGSGGHLRLTQVVYNSDAATCDGCGRSLDDKLGHCICDTCCFTRFLACRDCIAVGVTCRQEGHLFVPLKP